MTAEKQENLFTVNAPKYVEVESAVSLTEKQLDGLKKRLQKVLNSENFILQVKVNPLLLGGLSLKVDSLLIDASVKGQLQSFEREIERKVSAAVDVTKITDLFVESVRDFKEKTVVNEVGTVLSVSDGVAKVEGLNGIASGERVVFESGAHGMAFYPLQVVGK